MNGKTDVRCEYCDSNDFQLSEGFYYCSECGIRTNLLRETEYEHRENFRIKKLRNADPVREVKQLTSWEKYNFTLIGLVNELLSIHDCPNLKFTALQLWTCYLKEIEAAFFSEEEELPKMFALYRQEDAEILYGVKFKKYKQKYVSKRKKIHKTEKEVTKHLMKSQLKVATNEPMVNQTLENILTSREKVTRLNYSKAAVTVIRKRALNIRLDEPLGIDAKMPAAASLISLREKMHLVTMDTLICLLYCALNINKSDVQLCDLIRFINEGNLSYFQLSHFLPDSMGGRKNKDTKLKYMQALPNYQNLRRHVTFFVDMIPGLKNSLQIPNLLQLARRFTRELCLPTRIVDYVEILLKKFPFRRGHECYRFSTPVENYEGRMMAYILLILKFFFGLDDVYEREMSKRTQPLNMKMKKLKLDEPQLFDILEWLDFMDYRNRVLAKFYYPLTLHKEYEGDDQYLAYVDLLNHVQAQYPGDYNPFPGKSTPRVELNRNASKVMENLIQKYNASSQAVAFLPSLTPLQDVHDFILRNYSEDWPFDRKLLSKDFSKSDLEGYLFPDRIIDKMLANGTKVLKKRILMNENVTRVYMNYHKYKGPTRFRLSFDTNRKKWRAAVKKEKKKKARSKATYEKRRMKRNLQNMKFDKTIYILNFQDVYKEDSDGEDFPETKMYKFPIPCFKMWDFHIGLSVNGLSAARTEKEFQKIPKIMQRLVTLCSEFICQHPVTLYRQLCILENQIYGK